MRVLLVNENAGGGHRTVHASVTALLSGRAGIDVDVLQVPHPGSFAQRVVSAPVPGLARLDADLQPLRCQLAHSAWVRRQLRRRRGRFDVVHIYTQNCALLGAGSAAHAPTVVSTDSTTAHNAFRLPYRRPTRLTPLTVAASKRFERRTFEAARSILASSEWVARSLRSDYGISDERLVVKPVGISVPPAPVASSPGPSSGAAGRRSGLPRLVFVGTSLERKGGWELLRLHQAELLDRAELVLVTKDRVPPARNVEVIGDIEPGDGRLWSVLRSAAALVLPSVIDQAPNVVLEAAAAAVPVVAFDVAAVPEMVVDGTTGLLVATGDRRGLRAAIESLLDDPHRAEAMGAAGRRHIEEHYDVRSYVDTLVTHLRRAVDRRTATATRDDGRLP